MEEVQERLKLNMKLFNKSLNKVIYRLDYETCDHLSMDIVNVLKILELYSQNINPRHNTTNGKRKQK